MVSKLFKCLLFFVLCVGCLVDTAFTAQLMNENFDDQSINSSFVVYGSNWAVLSPPQYNLNAVGRDGSGHSFSSGTVNMAFLSWEKNLPNPWPSNEMYVSFWMRYPTFTSTDQMENIKLFYPHWNSTNSYVHYSMSSNDQIYYSARGNGNMLSTGNWISCPGQANGSWHHYEFLVNFASGNSKFWYDGSLKLDHTYGSGVWTPSSVYYIAVPSIDAEEPGVFSRQIDDLEVWDSMPSGSTSPPPPDSTPPGDVTNFSAQPGDGQAVLSWTNPGDADFSGTEIRYSTGNEPYPATHDDGMFAGDRPGAPGSNDSFTVTGLQNGVKYNFSAFTYDDSGNYSSTAHVSVTPTAATPGENILAWSAMDQSGDSSWSNSDALWTARVLVNGNSIVSGTGDSIKLGFQGNSSSSYRVKKISIAERDSNGLEGDVIDSTWTQVVFDGNSVANWGTDEMVVPAGTEKFTDPVPFNFLPGKDYYITFHLANPSAYLITSSGYKEMYFEDANREIHTEDIDWSGNGHSTYNQRIHAISSIYRVNGDDPGLNPPSGFKMISTQ